VTLSSVAPVSATVTLLLELAMGVGLLIGALLARRRRFRLHAWCQSLIVLLNLVVIVITMVPSFRAQVVPKLPLRLGKSYYALATTHAALGTITEFAGLYVLLAAGTRVVPERLRMTNYKRWMRAVLVLWWVVLLLGMATYARWYVPAEADAGTQAHGVSPNERVQSVTSVTWEWEPSSILEPTRNRLPSGATS